MAMDSQPFRGHIPNGVPPNRTYQEVYAENGRWYGTFKKGKYMFPIDERKADLDVKTELERLDVFHKVFLVARRDASHSAPLHNQENPRVLDLGCGTGIWGIDMADIPANMRFLQKDIEDRWQDLEPGSWDLIHMRALNGSISNWPRVYAEIYRDGYIVQWANQLMDAMDSFGRPIRLDSNLTKQRLEDVGFDEIKEEIIQLPLNGWPTDVHDRDLGRWFNLGVRQAFQPLSLAPLCRGHGRTPAEVAELAEKARREVYSNSVRAYCTLHIFTARKPR
ncbi:hypothetical protein B0I37DRAFT_349035 [Chaetomium sp. MPI-CAGE-AT-0009]|nr:hypothetical protein B0I37DRAFT_349035 [Chaetomium sp. MPI-CAGE-AT-0009]